MEYKGNAAGVGQMDTVAEKVGPLEMGVMDLLVVKTTMFAFLGQQVNQIIFLYDIANTIKPNLRSKVNCNSNLEPLTNVYCMRHIYLLFFVDIDNDGLVGNADNCPSNSNSDQLDTDNDGKSWNSGLTWTPHFPIFFQILQGRRF